jgi:MarR family transcriptional regulator, organic hydroperoxide resistance regulator
MFKPSEHDTLDHLLAQVARLHHIRAQTLFETVGLYRGQPPVLGLLAEQEGLRHSELAKRLEITPATTSKMLDRMEKTGFVMRRPDPEDQRVSRVYLTERGRAVQSEVHRLFATLEQETFVGFDEEERALMRRFLLQMRANLLRVTGDQAPC